MFWLFLSTSLHYWLPVVHGFCSSTHFSIALLYHATQEIHYTPRLCESLAVVHVHFVVGQLVAPWKILFNTYRCFIDVFFSERDYFASAKTIGISKIEIYQCWTISCVIKLYMLSLLHIMICVITKLITCMKWVE